MAISTPINRFFISGWRCSAREFLAPSTNGRCACPLPWAASDLFSNLPLGRDFFNGRTGFIAAAILATTMRVVWEARWAHVDMVFCAFFVFAVYFGARSLFHKGQPHEILFTYLFIALATLTKGLIGVVLPGLLFLAVMLVRREWRLIFVLKLHLGLPLFF